MFSILHTIPLSKQFLADLLRFTVCFHKHATNQVKQKSETKVFML